MNMGTYVVGKLKGYVESPWDNGTKSGTNRTLGIVVGGYVDKYGQQHDDIQDIEIPVDLVEAVKAKAKELEGKMVQTRVVFRARKGGASGAWLSAFMPKDSCLAEVKK